MNDRHLVYFVEIALLLATYVIRTTQGKNLLLIGDSIDRYVVTNWCKEHGLKKSAHVWGTSNIGIQKGSKQSSAFCKSSAGHNFASIHIFGSSEGPYLWINKDKFTATSVRTKMAIEQFQQMCPLDEVIFSAALWDMRPQHVLENFGSKGNYYFDTDLYMRNLSAIEYDTEKRLDEIVTLIGDKVQLGLRTTAWSPGYLHTGVGAMFREYNEMLRRLSISRNLTLYDYDSDMWSSVNYNYSQHDALFLDNIHPKHEISLLVGEKLVGQRFSKFYHTRRGPSVTVCSNPNASSWLSSSSSHQNTDDLLHRCSNLTISLIAESSPDNQDYSNSPFQIGANRQESLEAIDFNNLYYSEMINGTRLLWSNLTSAFLYNRTLGPGDIFRVPNNVLKTLVNLGPIPSTT